RECYACESTIGANARLCAQCGSRQNAFWRSFGRVVAIASGTSIVLTALTVGVTFYPQARALFAQPELSLYLIETHPVPKRVPSERDRTRVEFGVSNTGPTDLFLTRIVVTPLGPEMRLFRPKNFVVNQSVNKGQNFVVRLVVQDANIQFQPMNESVFDRIVGNTAQTYEKSCFDFFLNDADPFSPIEAPALSFTNSTMPLEVSLHYSSVSTRGKLKKVPQALKVTGTRLQRQTPECK
ncbi:unnamed protein product, partial [Chrysoparadoxa australica]